MLPAILGMSGIGPGKANHRRAIAFALDAIRIGIRAQFPQAFMLRLRNGNLDRFLPGHSEIVIVSPSDQGHGA